MKKIHIETYANEIIVHQRESLLLFPGDHHKNDQKKYRKVLGKLPAIQQCVFQLLLLLPKTIFKAKKNSNY